MISSLLEEGRQILDKEKTELLEAEADILKKQESINAGEETNDIEKKEEKEGEDEKEEDGVMEGGKTEATAEEKNDSEEQQKSESSRSSPSPSVADADWSVIHSVEVECCLFFTPNRWRVSCPHFMCWPQWFVFVVWLRW